ncbi:MAG TPA: ATP12 family protein [Devosia sp.]|nr:ATP12 family protein [Devosia sp.]
MRDYLEDADKHRDDGYGRAQHHAKQQLPKRFYKDVGVGTAGDGFAVTLDGRSPRTPGQKPVVVPGEALARAMADEWAAQGEFIDPATMPIVRLVNSAIEGGDERLQAFRDEVLKYAGNDLLLYRADAPRELVAEQEKHWDGALTKLARHFDIGFQPTMGIMHQLQPAPTLAQLGRALADETLIPLVAMVSLTGITGSGLLTLALRHGLMTPDEVWDAAQVDEDHNTRLWGDVTEASERREKRRRDFDAAVRVLEMMGR